MNVTITTNGWAGECGWRSGRPAVARVISRLAGTAMIILGALLLGEHLVH
jgi:hypothetical protein